MNKRPLYFDYAATTPVDARVIQVMVDCLGFEGNFGNPASGSHVFGQQARHTVERAREQVAELINAQPEQIIWTSGATESNNLALKGVAHASGKVRGHIITSQIEHKAVLDTARFLEQSGFDVTYLAPDSNGLVSVQQVGEALREDTLLVSLMLVNNELGTVNDIPAIGLRVREHGALFHVDAAQGAGKIAIDLKNWAVDLMSFSGHKVYGPKGIGALYVGPRAQARLQAQIHGAGMSSAFVPVPWLPTKLLAWVLPSRWPASHLRKTSIISAVCVSVCWSSWPIFRECDVTVVLRKESLTL